MVQLVPTLLPAPLGAGSRGSLLELESPQADASLLGGTANDGLTGLGALAEAVSSALPPATDGTPPFVPGQPGDVPAVSLPEASPGGGKGGDGGFGFGLATNPLFSAGIEGLLGGNPLDGVRHAAVLKDRQQQQAFKLAAAQREQAELQQVHSILAEAAERTGDPALTVLVEMGLDGIDLAMKRFQSLSAQETPTPPPQEAGAQRPEPENGVRARTR